MKKLAEKEIIHTAKGIYRKWGYDYTLHWMQSYVKLTEAEARELIQKLPNFNVKSKNR